MWWQMPYPLCTVDPTLLDSGVFIYFLQQGLDLMAGR